MDFHSVSRFFTKDNTYDIDRILKLHSSSLSVLEAGNERSRKSRKFLTIFSRPSIVHFSRNPSNLWYVTLVEVWFDDVYEMDPSFIDVHRGVVDTMPFVVSLDVRWPLIGHRSQWWTIPCGRVEAWPSFFSFFLFPVFLFPFVYSFISRRFIDSGREPTGRLTANNLLALPCLPLSATYIRVTRKCIHMCNENEVHAWYKRVTHTHTHVCIYTDITRVLATNLNVLRMYRVC